MKTALLLLTAFCAYASAVKAATIQWGGSVDGVYLQSDGSELTSDFRFELGVFEGGFIPDISNTFEWEDNWLPLDESFFNATDDVFGSVLAIADTAVSGSQAFIWGRTAASPPEGQGEEAVLFTSSDWVVPTPATHSTTLLWRAKAADTLIVGGLNGESGPGDHVDPPDDFHIMTHELPPAAPPVPEPSAALLLIFSGAALLLRRGRRS